MKNENIFDFGLRNLIQKFWKMGMKINYLIFDKFIRCFICSFVGQPAPGGGGTPSLWDGGIHERFGKFSVFVLRFGLRNIL